MFEKPKKPKELLIYERLRGRFQLTKQEERRFFQLKSGYEGELNFSNMIPKALSEYFKILYDVNLKYHGKVAQFDVLFYSDHIIFHFDIKNYSNDYYIENGRWFRKGSGEIENPLYQLERADMLLRRFVNEENYQMSVASQLVFIHPTFQLYHAKIDEPYIFRSQLTRRFEELIKTQPKNSFHTYKNFYNAILKAYRIESTYTQYPEYKLTEVSSGIKCRECRRELACVTRQTFYCVQCRMFYSSTDVVLDHIKEFHLLFPEEKLTAQNIRTWCNKKIGISAIYRGLQKYEKKPRSLSEN